MHLTIACTRKFSAATKPVFSLRAKDLAEFLRNLPALTDEDKQDFSKIVEEIRKNFLKFNF